MSEQQPTPAGPDLARQALASWKAAAKSRPATGATKPRKNRKAAQYGDARDPVGVGSVITRLGAEREWLTAVQGGSITDRWDSVCPTALRGKVEIEGFDPDTRVLILKPASPTVAQFLRTFGPQLVTQLQEARLPVRAINVQGFGQIQLRTTEEPPKQVMKFVASPVPAEPSPGYRDALEGLRATKPDRQDTDMQRRTKEAAEQQSQALRAHREAEDGHAEAVWFTDNLEQQRREERDRLIRQLARDQRESRGPDLGTAFQRTA